jgi:hypothetical protein
MKNLDKRAKEAIFEQIAELGEITTEAVMDLVTPHYAFNPRKAKEREIRRRANSLMSQFRDEQGIRTCFNYKDVDGQSKYVNVDETKNQTALNRVEQQINSKYDGLTKTKVKIERRQLKLNGQLGLFDKSAQ